MTTYSPGTAPRAAGAARGEYITCPLFPGQQPLHNYPFIIIFVSGWRLFYSLQPLCLIFVYTHETGHCLLCLLSNNSKNVLFCSIITSSDIIIIDLTISEIKVWTTLRGAPYL